MGTFHCIFLIETSLCFLLGILGLILLFTSHKQKPSDLMLVHLTMCNMTIAAINIAYVVTIDKGKFKGSTMWFINSIGVTIYFPILITLIIITIDRILAVNLLIRYKIVVTNVRLAKVLVVVWLTSVGIGVSCWFLKSVLFMYVILCLSPVIAIFFIVSYTYIIIKVHKRRKIVSATKQNNHHKCFINVWVPFTIVMTYLIFVVTTDITVICLEEMNIWHFIVWNFNYILDTLTYILGSARIRAIIVAKWRALLMKQPTR